MAIFGCQACFALPYVSEGFQWITENDLEVIRRHFTRRPESLDFWWGSKVELYAYSPNERITVMDMKSDMLILYAANNQNAFEGIQKILKTVGEPY